MRWSDFNPSPLSTRYFSTRELRELVDQQGFSISLYGASPASNGSRQDRLLSVLERMAVRLRLIPKAIRGKAVLKRIFLGRLEVELPELTDDNVTVPLIPIIPGELSSRYKVIYAAARA